MRRGWQPAFTEMIPSMTVEMFLNMPFAAHTAVITQPDLLHAFIEPFLKGQMPKGMFEK